MLLMTNSLAAIPEELTPTLVPILKTWACADTDSRRNEIHPIMMDRIMTDVFVVVNLRYPSWNTLEYTPDVT